MGNIYKESFNTAKDIEIYEGIRIQNSVHNISFKTLVTKLENWDFVIISEKFDMIKTSVV